MFSLCSLSSADLSFRGQVIKALQSKQGVENGPLVFILLPHNAVRAPAVMEQVHGLQKPVKKPTKGYFVSFMSDIKYGLLFSGKMDGWNPAVK